MSDPITIRDAGLFDYQFLCATLEQANEEHCRMAPDYYRQVEPGLSKMAFYLAFIVRLTSHRVCVKIAEKQGQSVGAVIATSQRQSSFSWSRFDKEAYLANVVVLPEHRRTGVGMALVKAVQNWAKDSGHAYLAAKIVANNDASLALFEKAGLSRISVGVGMHIK